MAQSLPINLAMNSYKSRSGLASAERLVNCYAEPNQVTSPFKTTIYGTSGLVPWKDTSVPFAVIGMQVMAGDLYFVLKNGNVYKIDTSKTLTVLGTIPSTITNVIMTNNGIQMTILTDTGASYYCTSSASSLAQISDPDYELSDSVATLDGYTVFTKQGGRTFQWSALNNTASYNSLDKQTVEADSDKIIRVAMNNLELWFFKENITEVYYNSARSGFIFDRKDGVFIQKGCAAKRSVASLDGSFYFLGNDRIVYQTIGYQLKQVSTFPISQEIETYSTVSDASAFCYTEGGHKFYAITFPTANKTWEYNITTELWHERESVSAASAPSCWRANCHAFFVGKNLVGDHETGVIYELDKNTYTENQARISRKVVATTIFSNYGRASLNRIILMLDTGVGVATGQGDDPQLMLRVSTDGGKTYGFEMWQPIGRIGDYFTEVFWSNCGFGRTAILEITISDPVKFAVVGAYIDAQLGDS